MTDDALDLTAGVPLSDVPVGGLLAGTVGEEPVMLARWTDESGAERVSALDATCTHVGAQLPTGLRTGDLVRCPFHHACFDLRTGEATLAPAYAPLRRWATTVSDGVVTVAGSPEPAPGPAEQVTNTRGVERVVVLGGGAAGFAAVEKLRRVGYEGSLVLLTTEPAPPVDRTKLSKAYLSGAAPAAGLPLLPGQWYAEHDVDVRTGVTATALDTDARALTLDDGTTLRYDALVLAPGSQPTRPDLPGFDRADVHVLRSVADADAIVAGAGAGTRAVVVGSGFIGLEVAASLRSRELDVTVVAPSPVPLARQLGEDLGRVLRDLHESNGVRFVTGRAAGWDGAALQLEDGAAVPADVVVVGLGVAPSTALAEAAGLAVDDGILVDATGETGVRGVFAAGDAARFPDPATGRMVRVEHWAQAQRAGALAAVNLLGAGEELTEPPYFWSMQYGKSVRFAGHAASTDDAEVEGPPADLDAVVRFREDGRVTAVAGIGRDRRVLELEDELLRR